MPLLKTTRPYLYVEADAYILIHHGNSSSDFMAKRMFRCAGPQMLEAYHESGITLYGDPVITPGFGLNAKYVIHILQPRDWEKDPVTKAQYRKALLLAQEYHCESVVFSTPPYYEEITKVNSVCRSFAQESDMTIYLSKSGDNDAGISRNLLDRLKVFLGVDDEAEKFEEFERSTSVTNSPYEENDRVEDLSPDNRPIPFGAWKESVESYPRIEKDEDRGIWEDKALYPQAPRRKARPQSSTPRKSKRPEASMPQAAKPKGLFQKLQEFLKQNDAGFKDTLLKYIDRTGKKDSEIYRKANVDRRLFSKIMNVEGYNPSKPTAIAFAIALELNLEETKDLIGRSGYTLSQASTFDRIIEFFILERNYDIYEINEALFYFDQSLLGG